MTSGISEEMEEIQMACDEDDDNEQQQQYLQVELGLGLLRMRRRKLAAALKKMEMMGHCYKWKSITANKKKNH
jgi:hypothetical protein